MDHQSAGVVRTLLLLRHAEAVAIAPGRRDADRPLTAAGRVRAAEIGAALRAAGPIDLVICSPTLRTRETCDALGLAAPVMLDSSLAHAGSDTIRAALADAVRGTEAEPRTVLVIGHAPGIPALAYDLADPAESSATARAAIEHGYPPATLCRLETTDSWDALRSAQLVSADMGR